MARIRTLAFVILGGAAFVGGQVVVAKILPPLGSVFFLITIAFLEAIEDYGIPTMRAA